ncbi:YjcZ family sporulation protein [Alkalihalobacillus sp. MEB130]|nr:YjcZ family sporulation protein [Alkalihalobacillus sp. MEB130]MDT8858835.1 YjcZ family sporulation protein [Alkalihalobacillus sp. MEB130]
MSYGYDYGYGYGCGAPVVAGAYHQPRSGFALIVVLFILLIIIGASFVKDDKKHC